MPLTEKGKKILEALIKQYGEEDAKRILYAGKNAGTFEGIDAKRKRDDDEDEDENGDYDFDEFEDAKTVRLSDSYLIDSVRKTKDGYLAANARIARTGIQLYDGKELGMPDRGVVRVYRPPGEVFSKKAMQSLAHLPVTLTHPPVMVDSKNWDEYAIGHVDGEVARDGDAVRVNMLLMDAKAVEAYERHGVRELSVGYTTELKWGRGRTPTGETYDAKQTAIRGNHLAVVPAARGGSLLRIGDDQRKETDMVKILIDGQTIELADDLVAKHVQQYINRLLADQEESKKKVSAAEAEKIQAEEKKLRAETDAKTKDGEIVVLKKQLEDAQSEEALDARVEAKTNLLLKASAAMDGKVDFKGKKPADIHRMVVAAHLGDEMAKTFDAAQMEGAFRAITANIKQKTGVDKLADSLNQLQFGGGNQNDPKALKDAAYSEMVTGLTNAWKGAGRQ